MMLLRVIRGILTAAANGSKRLLGLFSPATVAALSGVALMAYGLWVLYEPLAYIVPGATLTLFGLWLAGAAIPKRGD